MNIQATEGTALQQVWWRRLGAVMLPLLLGCSGVWVGQGRSLATEFKPPIVRANDSLPSQPPLDVNALLPGQAPPGVGTSTTISPTQLTVPSLWWIQEQISSTEKFQELKKQFGRPLVINWLSYPISGKTPGRVDLVVDRQIWGTLDYFDRYQFLNSYSAIARSYGYNIRIFDNQATIVAAFTCTFTPLDLFLLQLSTELSGIPLLEQSTANYSRSPIADQLSCEMAVETGLSAFFRRTSTPFK